VPIKNESWILVNFIECALTWADFVIVGDHCSSDDSANIVRQYAQKYNTVKIIPIPDRAYEDIRRKVLIDEARKIPGRRLIFSIDADEMISANWTASSEWDLMLNAAPGTRFHFDWIELWPGLKQCCIFGMTAAFVDDDTEYHGVKIHSPRIPATTGTTVELKDIKLLHYVLIEPARMFSRHRWYKCYEYVEIGEKPWDICVSYQDTQIKTYDRPVVPAREEWLKYEWLDKYKSGEETGNQCYWWDQEILDYFNTYGVQKFSKLNIWDVDWNHKAKLLGRKGDYPDPRSNYEISIHRFIEKYREDLKFSKKLLFRAINKFARTVLRAFGW
jgi:glycosyltransferase involved in cell wall biosynthesis